MKSFRLWALAIIAVLASSVVASATAYAESEWLVEKIALGAAFSAETEFEFEFVKLASATNKKILTAVLCAGFFIGTIGAGVNDKVTELLSLAKVLVNLSVAGLDCPVQGSGENGLTDCRLTAKAEVWAENLPWNSKVVLDNGATFLDTLESSGAGEPAWAIKCITESGIVGEETCTLNTSAELTNSLTMPPSVLGKFSEAAGSALANCSLTGTETGEIIGEGHTYNIENNTRLETAVS